MLLNVPMARCLLAYPDLSNLVLHDWAAMILASLYGNIFILNDSTILYRQHGGNVVGAVNKTGMNGIKRQMQEVLRFRKLNNIRNSVELEKKIIKQIMQKSDNNYIPKSNLKDLNLLFSENKALRVVTYLKVNKKMGFRGIVRAMFA